MWTDAIKHAAWLVLCPDDTPKYVVKLRCEAANTIKRQWDEIKRLEARNGQLGDALDLLIVAIVGCDTQLPDWDRTDPRWREIAEGHREAMAQRQELPCK